MRKEVKKAKENVETALSVLKNISSRDSIPDKVRNKALLVVESLENTLEELNSIINTYTQ